MSPPPQISIIIPVYNAELFLESCLDSATQQTLNEIEIICVDDASSDASHDILSRYASNDKRIRILQHETNKGEGASRNTGLNNAKGSYVFHLDADDTIPLNAMEKLFNAADLHHSDMIKGGFIMVYEDGKTDDQVYSIPEEKIINTNIYESEFLQEIPTSHCSYLYNRHFLNQHDIRYRTDLAVGLDLVALATALKHAKKVTLLTDIVYHYYQSSTSVIRGRISPKIALDAIRAKAMVVDILNEVGMPEVAATRLKNWYFIITTYWQRMPDSLSTSECSEVFLAFRTLISNNNIIPWGSRTPAKHRYILAMILANEDEMAISFLRTDESVKGFSDQGALKNALLFILQQAPEDTESLSKLGSILLDEGNTSEAIGLFERAIKTDKLHIDANLQCAAALMQLGRYQEAHSMVDTVISNLIQKQRMYNQLEKAVTIKSNIYQSEIESLQSKSHNACKKADSIRSKLNAVYASPLWKITSPLRRLKAIFKPRS